MGISKSTCDKYSDLNILYYGIGIHPHDAAKNNNHKINMESELLIIMKIQMIN